MVGYYAAMFISILPNKYLEDAIFVIFILSTFILQTVLMNVVITIVGNAYNDAEY